MNKLPKHRICPICGKDNGCQYGTLEESNCWCMHTKVPENVLRRIPAEKRRTACVCQACVKRYQNFD